MKSTPLILVYVAFFSLASCSKSSLFEVDATPAIEQSSKSLSNQHSSIFAKISSSPVLFDTITTIQLQIIRNTISTTTGEYVIFLSSNQNLAGVQLKNQQQLDFVDTDGQVVSRTYPVHSFEIEDNLLQISFLLGRDGDDGLDLEPTQSIVIEDILIN